MSASAIQPAGGGMYTMDGNSYDLSTLISTLGIQRANLIEGQILDQANAMKRRNEAISGLSTALAALRGLEAKDKTDDADSKNLFNANTTMSGVQKPDGSGEYSVAELMQSQGMTSLKSEAQFGGADWVWGRTERKEAIEAIKGKIDSLNSDSQMDQIRLQGLVTKRDQNFDMVSNLMSKDAKTKDTIIGNMR